MNAGSLGRVENTGATRRWVWLQLVIGWLPVWALYSALIITAHDGPVVRSVLIAGRAIFAAAVLSLLVMRLVNRLAWPRHITVQFVVVHACAALLFAMAWVLLTSLIESIMRWQAVLAVPPGLVAAFLVMGLWLYVAVAGVMYAVRATERVALAEAEAAQSRLAALRSQLNPHFLFNAMHTVVQLIPVDPARASDAAETLAALLRTALEENRDVVPLREERAFVERYLDLERIRFGDRLQTVFDVPADAGDLLVPAFALQTLVENAVRHGAAPRLETTRITITARRAGDTLHLSVADTGAGLNTPESQPGTGTGLNRLRARLEALYAGRGQLRITSAPHQGVTADLSLPLVSEDQD